MKFWTSLPGLSRWPPASFSVPGANWQEHLAAADFQPPAGFTKMERPAGPAKP